MHIDVARFCSAEELIPPRDAKSGDRAQVVGYHVGLQALEGGKCFSLMSTTTNHRSEGVEGVSDEAPPMPNSGRVRERKERKTYPDGIRLNKERRVQGGLFLDRRDMVLGRRSRTGSWSGLERAARSSGPEVVMWGITCMS
ncbi:hypothetical protein F511_28982 [Dorcoceras hygrometricum]|uniref:Uncharacterized protein n=1 Tax=Dorcoceras hygrometricum TaxID=472368 RepID=A0A2Z7DC49_9LAMI|nr:hypothetical protein F511_28982 [Dorcoceras hygrometricum]